VPAPLRILVLCTANQCRSPMAAAFLARRLPRAEVSSAGAFGSGMPASDGAVRVMAARGIDLAEHRSRVVDADALHEADLVIAMARSHVREAVVRVPAALRKTYTLRELVRRGERVGPAGDLSAWLDVVGTGRRPADLMGDDPDDDIADPMGQPDAAYERTVDILDDLIGRLGALLESVAGE
jgi:protein-tyrosine phosphatase